MTLSEPTQILFVDAEPALLSGFRKRFRRNKQWSMHFATCTDEALLLMQNHAIDILVSDLWRPFQHGVDFLQQATPHCKIRILLTAHTQALNLLNALPLTHHILHKPCAGELLQNTLLKVETNLHRRRNSSIQKVISKVTTLPILDRLHQELYAALNDESVPLNLICNTLKKSPPLCARLLQWVNSCLVSLPHPVHDVQEAVRMLGLDIVRQMVIITELFEHWEGHQFHSPFTMSDFQQHSNKVAVAAAQAVPEHQKQAYTAGLLHDLGHLMMMAYCPPPSKPPPHTMEGLAPLAHETRTYGFHHAELGAALLEMWGLPTVLIEAVEHHHNLPWILKHQHHLAGALYLAHQAPLSTPQDLDLLLAQQLSIP